jgi:glycosyltransferase involved in cell wall biosynthesis
MRIAFLVNEVAGGWEPNDDRLGGTEEGVREWAAQLAHMGHAVSVFHNGRPGNYYRSGYVHYMPRESYELNTVDVTINVKSSDVAPVGPTIYLTNEVNASEIDLSAYGAVVLPSQWAKDNIPVNNHNVHIIPYGFNPANIRPGTKRKQQILYASSPDRGLAELLAVWPEVYAACPAARLKVTYGATGDPADFPGVEFMGDVNEETMDKLYQESDVWCHPCTGIELFCITGIKAQAAGCVPVYYPTMALRETVRAGIMTNPQLLANDLIDTLRDELVKEEIRGELASETFATWNSSARDLLMLINAII